MSDDAPYGLDDPQRPADDSAARRRVAIPALFLLIVSVLNLLAGLDFMVDAIFIKNGSPQAQAQLDKQWDDLGQEWRDALAEQGWTEESYFMAIANMLLGWGALTSLAGVFALFGSIRMRVLQSYGLAMLGAVLTARPCVTPCCLIGQIAGIWAVIVLMNPEVRKAFH